MNSSFSPKRKLITVFLFVFCISIIFTYLLLSPYTPVSYGAIDVKVPPDYKVPTDIIKPEEAKVTLAAKLTPSASSVGFSEFPDRYPNIFSYIRSLFDGQSFFKSSGEGAPQGGIAPNDNTCNGYYDFNTRGKRGFNPLHKNFGDPKCEFASNMAKSKDDLKSLLNTLNSTNATKWFQMIERESSYIPNAYAGPDTGTPDQGGAWGLLQMGRGDKNGPHDKGDVYWRNQVENAITDIKTRKYNSCDYWQAARDLSVRDSSYCFTVQ